MKGLSREFMERHDVVLGSSSSAVPYNKMKILNGLADGAYPFHRDSASCLCDEISHGIQCSKSQVLKVRV